MTGELAEAPHRSSNCARRLTVLAEFYLNHRWRNIHPLKHPALLTTFQLVPMNSVTNPFGGFHGFPFELAATAPCSFHLLPRCQMDSVISAKHHSSFSSFWKADQDLFSKTMSNTHWIHFCHLLCSLNFRRWRLHIEKAPFKRFLLFESRPRANQSL